MRVGALNAAAHVSQALLEAGWVTKPTLGR